MDRAELFDRNLLALHGKSPELCTLLSNSETTKGYYQLVYSKNNLPVPAIIGCDGLPKPLHSLFDPEKEAERIIGTIEKTGFLIIFGLGGGYLAKKALERNDIQSILIVDFNVDSCAELLSLIDYVNLFSNPRISVLFNPSQEYLFNVILSTYKPAFHGGIQVLPLRPRLDHDPDFFKSALEVITSSIEAVSEDYSVQAYFGKPWFSNTIRNVILSEKHNRVFTLPQNVSVTAAGPSLELQIPLLKQERHKTFLFATDTSLPTLIAYGIEPDAVISIDCQHISYYHFVSGKPRHIPLFLDLSSPPVLATLSDHTYFFSGGHPLTQYISRYWKPFPVVDTSGGNVTYAAIALADQLGASQISLYGADFSYPEGETYARGTYIHRLFHYKQDRLHPVEALFSGFLFRNIQLSKVKTEKSWRYETKPLTSYRKKLEALSERIQARLIIVDGKGAPIRVCHIQQKMDVSNVKTIFTTGMAKESARDFLESYLECIKGLPQYKTNLAEYMQQLSEQERDAFVTLLPLAAFIRRIHDDIPLEHLLAQVKDAVIQEISSILHVTAK